MLKRLELIGFKSFADRTRFDFAPGITAVVGPNGSGKSNVVDAVRWLLGEQSAKSLRGGEMTDCIFNGSATRKSLGLAEVSMLFDNAGRTLGLDADDVLITRRVYRDGDGEYLVNGKPARRKDVTDLFLGSGAGHGAYSVIEQGRVDALLASSPADRRAIFEEASGVSRFRAKKQESARKLERVDADLLRVHDILRELDAQLRTLRLAAAKAERFADYSARLTALRAGRARAEHAAASEQLAATEAERAGLGAELAAAADATAAHEAELTRLDGELSRADDTLRHHEGRRADSRRRAAAHQATADAGRRQAAELAAERLRLLAGRADLVRRTRHVEAEAARVGAAADAAATQDEAARAAAASAAAAEQAAAGRASALSKQVQADLSAQFALANQVGQLGAEAGAARQQEDRLGADLSRKRTAAERADAEAAAVERLLAVLSESDAGLQARLSDARRTQADTEAARADLGRRGETLQEGLAAARQERGELQGRADVLAARERELDGFGAGVRAVLERVRAGDPALAGVVGLVAELVSAPRGLAPLVDLALGDAAQRFVVRADALPGLLAAVGEVPGRVGFVPLDDPPVEMPVEGDGVAALVACDTPGLAARLLGATRLVPDRTHAVAGERCVTRGGELVEPDGTVVVGPADAGGFLSRKSELHDLRGRLADLAARIAAGEADLGVVRRRADELDAAHRAWADEIAVLAGEAGSLRDAIVERRQVQRQLADTRELLAVELRLLGAERDKAATARRAAEGQAAAVGAEAAALTARLDVAKADLLAAAADRERLAVARREAEVAAGRGAEQLSALRRQRAELDAERRQRGIDAVNHRTAEAAARGKHQEAELTALAASAAAAALIADAEARGRQVREQAAARHSLRDAREQTAALLADLRARWQGRQDAAHALGLAAADLLARRAAAERQLQELGAWGAGRGTPEPLGSIVPSSDDDEADLRAKLAKLGAVNPEAVAELASVQAREQELRAQFDDLSEARGKLTALVDEINADSRRLFAATLEAVRGHFRELFRTLFGGGSADVTLDGDDVLEAGIEVTAKPPGKEAQKLSLLSGGERALTAVALLLALFRTKPSPFCLLDEVDAAMDEANTQRLAAALRTFAGRTQFVVVTHKKRTMAAADVLYGVTMQESGVSKRVSVRFEDWPDDEPAHARAA